MKIKLLLITLSLSLVSMALACSGERNKGESHRDRMINKLNLNEQQSTQFITIMQEKHENMQAAMNVVHTDTIAQLEKVLSPEQMKMLNERKERHSKKKFNKHRSH